MKPRFPILTAYKRLRGGRNCYELTEDVATRIPALEGHTRHIRFLDHKGKEWARIEGDVLIVLKGYAWNGASPKRWLFGRFWGTPDFPETMLATLIHDVCFQFYRTRYWPEQLNYDQCNLLFRMILLESKFRWANLYFGAVRDFGQHFTGEYPERGEYSELILS